MYHHHRIVIWSHWSHRCFHFLPPPPPPPNDKFQSLSFYCRNPHTESVAQISNPFAPAAVIESISFSYRYLTGYGPLGIGANFSVWIGNVSVYASPHFTNYTYDANSSLYRCEHTTGQKYSGILFCLIRM